jgi:hypothetical protein
MVVEGLHLAPAWLQPPCVCPGAQMDVVPLDRFNACFPVDEPQRMPPLYIERVSVRDVGAAAREWGARAASSAHRHASVGGACF